MSTPIEQKSTIDQIRERFDHDVGRFSQVETGQTATIDAPLSMELITKAAVASTLSINQVLDIGSGAGNNTVKLRQVLGKDFIADLLDLSKPMLVRAKERVSAINAAEVNIIAGDFRTADLRSGCYDVVLAAAVLHHLRDDSDWLAAFEKIFRILKPGGSVWITDLVSHETDAIHGIAWTRYSQYLTSLGGEEYKNKVF